MSGAGIRYDTVVLDVDGTLVDTVYQHVVIWAEAFAAYDVHVPLWRIHRAIGMGGDRLVTEVAGEDVEKGGVMWRGLDSILYLATRWIP